MVPITIVNGVYKPSNITGGPHLVYIYICPCEGFPLLAIISRELIAYGRSKIVVTIG